MQRTNHRCDCADPYCSSHVGDSYCESIERTKKHWRVDLWMPDPSNFCPACSDDAMDSGLFTTTKPKECR